MNNPHSIFMLACLAVDWVNIHKRAAKIFGFDLQSFIRINCPIAAVDAKKGLYFSPFQVPFCSDHESDDLLCSLPLGFVFRLVNTGSNSFVSDTS